MQKKHTTQKFIKIIRHINESNLFSKREREYLVHALAEGHDEVSVELKFKFYEALLMMRRRLRKSFGMLVVLGWRRVWNERYSAISDVTQNIFSSRHFDGNERPVQDLFAVLKKTADFDGAILANKDGVLVASGVYLEGVRPKDVAEILHPGRTEDLSAAFGFASKVHTRHLSAIAASYRLKGTTIFVLSEEDRSLRIFEDGKIIWSTHRDEAYHAIQEK